MVGIFLRRKLPKRILATGIGTLLLCSGCTRLFSLAMFRSAAPERSDSALLRPLPTPQHAVQIEAIFVSRPPSDPALGPSLWKELDQIASVDAQTRQNLKSQGLQFGLAAAHPPQAVYSLLNTALKGKDSSVSFERIGRQLVMRAGAETELVCNDALPECLVKSLSTVDNEPEQAIRFENANCILRLRIDRVQDRWARVQLTPEIHHDGQSHLFQSEQDGELKPQQAKEISSFPEQLFSVDLNIGEWLVVGMAGQSENSLGQRFFGPTKNRKEKRVLLIRLTGMSRVDPVYASQE